MAGFFTSEETKPKKVKERSCVTCGLYKDCISPRMKPYGNFKKGILNIAEIPDEYEDSNGKPFQGRAGKLLQRTYRNLGIDLFEDCLNINAVSCRPIDSKGNNRTPTNEEIITCRRRVLRVIEEYKPKVIILLGFSAIFSVIGERWKKEIGTITKWRGWMIPDQDFGAYICPTFHPSYVERANEKTEVEELIWKQDLQQAFNLIEAPFPKYKEPEIEVIEDLSILEYTKIGSIKARNTLSLIAFDYETTGLKPHSKGHEIICCSVADSPDHVYVFMMPKTRKECEPFINILANPNIKKIASNMKFEHSWSQHVLNQTVEGWEWDTMIMSHILDNRRSITGLKFQTYINFGIVDYASEIAPYLEGDKNNANSFNHIKELLEISEGKAKLLKYCALDSIFEYRLMLKQQTLIQLNA